LNSSVFAIAVAGTNIYVGGTFTNAGGIANADYIARWDGAAWHALGPGLNSSVSAIAVTGTDVYVGGAFTDAGGDPNADRIARWDSAAWRALGPGLNSTVYAVATAGSHVYVGGGFTDAGGDPNADRIARWGTAAACAPDLQVSKANDTGGDGTVGLPFAWTLTVTNTGVTDAIFDTGQTILEDDLPIDPTYGAPVTGSFVNVTNGANVDCSIASNTLTCDATGGSVTIGASGGFEVAFSVTPSDTGTLSNPAGICLVDPNGKVGEGNEGNNDCPTDTVTVTTWITCLPIVLRAP
jgi:hypothetical protein